MATTTELLLSKEIGQLGDSGFNATFRTLFLTKDDEVKFNSNLNSKSLNLLIKDARTKISQTDADINTQNSYLIDQIEASAEINDVQKKRFVMIILENLEFEHV